MYERMLVRLNYGQKTINIELNLSVILRLVKSVRSYDGTTKFQPSTPRWSKFRRTVVRLNTSAMEGSQMVKLQAKINVDG